MRSVVAPFIGVLICGAAYLFACGKSLDDDDGLNNSTDAAPDSASSDSPNVGTNDDASTPTDAEAGLTFCQSITGLFCSDFTTSPAKSGWPTAVEKPSVMAAISTTSDAVSKPSAADLTASATQVVDSGIEEVAILKTSQLPLTVNRGTDLSFALKIFTESKPPYVVAKLDYFDALDGPIVFTQQLFVAVTGALALYEVDTPGATLVFTPIPETLPFDKYVAVRLRTPLKANDAIVVEVDGVQAKRTVSTGPALLSHAYVTLTIGIDYNKVTEGPVHLRLDNVLLRLSD